MIIFFSLPRLSKISIIFNCTFLEAIYYIPRTEMIYSLFLSVSSYFFIYIVIFLANTVIRVKLAMQFTHRKTKSKFSNNCINMDNYQI